MVVSVMRMPAALTPKSSALWIRPGKPSIRMRWPLAGEMAGPGIMPNHHAAIFCIRACGDKRAAVLGRSQHGQLRFLVLFLVPLDVVRIPFEKSVQRDHVPYVELHSVR